jgi:hypothetical protein
MADPRLERLFRSLDATFDAVLGAEEMSSADDLALSFRQGLTVPDLLLRHPANVCVEDRAFGPASFVGTDYIECGSSRSLVRTDRALIKVKREGAPAASSEESLLRRLRRGVRSQEAARVTIGVRGSTFEGRLKAASPDHLEVSRSESVLLIPLTSVEWVRFGLGG